MTRYDYSRKPRSINGVSLFVLLILAGAGYAGWKFGPVYWQAQKVDEALDEIKLEVANIEDWKMDDKVAAQRKISAKAIARIHELGIEDQEDQPVEVFFSPDYRYIQAKYEIIVRHPVLLKPTKMIMNRKVRIPRTRAL
jgi:hypothetical protein